MKVYYYEERKFMKSDGSEWGMDESGKMIAHETSLHGLSGQSSLSKLDCPHARAMTSIDLSIF
jgi:hypothetical protein